ncbi:MAG: hypothetical protein ABSB40_08905 [Nitrososphaeria archaeon]
MHLDYVRFDIIDSSSALDGNKTVATILIESLSSLLSEGACVKEPKWINSLRYRMLNCERSIRAGGASVNPPVVET